MAVTLWGRDHERHPDLAPRKEFWSYRYRALLLAFPLSADSLVPYRRRRDLESRA